MCAKKWAERGYIPEVMLDPHSMENNDFSFPVRTVKAPTPFPGYYKVINSIVKQAFFENADLVTCIGDDMLPPEQGAREHTKLYYERFADGFGVMQGTGDRQGEPIEGRVNSERICGSPTFGVGWFMRAFGGMGPFPQSYSSFYADEELKEVACILGVLYQEPKIKIDHEHWAFGRARREWWHETAQKNWEKDQSTFFERKKLGFPCHAPLPKLPKSLV